MSSVSGHRICLESYLFYVFLLTCLQERKKPTGMQESRRWTFRVRRPSIRLWDQKNGMAQVRRTFLLLSSIVYLEDEWVLCIKPGTEICSNQKDQILTWLKQFFADIYYIYIYLYYHNKPTCGGFFPGCLQQNSANLHFSSSKKWMK